MAFPIKRGKIWYGVWWEGHGKTRKQIWKSLKVSGPKTPTKELNKLNEDIEAKRHGKSDTVTWLAFCRQYLEWSEINKVKQSVERDRITIKMFDSIVTVPGIKDIQPYHLEQYKIARKKMSSQRNNETVYVKDSTINREMNTLKAMMNWAVEMGYLDRSPWRSVKKFNLDKSQPETFCGKEEELSKACETPYERAVLCLGIYQGLRRGEMANLRWEDIDFKDASMRVVSTMGRRTKSKRERWLPLHPKTGKALKSLAGGQEGYVLGKGERRANEDQLSQLFRAILTRTGIPGTLHKTRHTLGTNLAMAKVDPKTIMEILGHSRITTTEIYLRSNETLKRQAILALG